MISTNYDINEFVKNVSGKDRWDVVALAIEEATAADRLCMKTSENTEKEMFQTYSSQLKQFINYHRFAAKPRFPQSKAYILYMAHWGNL
jgi:hypothetical protein